MIRIYFPIAKTFLGDSNPCLGIRIYFPIAQLSSSDSNPSLSDSNLFSRNQNIFRQFESLFKDSNLFSSSSIVFKRFESLFRGFESLCKKPKNFKIINRRFESLFRGFESTCLLKHETVKFFQNPTVSSPNFSFNPPPNLSQKCFKSKISSKPTLIPISYHHITSFHRPKHLNHS